MKIAIIPDVHGSHQWEIIKEKINEVDYIVFLGDYFDSWTNKWPDQGNNFINICNFKKEYPDKVKLLLGNHDFAYISRTFCGKNCSGHQFSKEEDIHNMIVSNSDIIDLAFECDGWVFSHAGFSKTAVASMKKIMEKIFKKKYSIDSLNECFHNRETVKDPELSFDTKLGWDGDRSGTGDEKTQFCLWIRPRSLLEDAYYPKQVVGHTEICFNTYEVFKNKKNNIVVVCDSSEHSIFEIFDTQNNLKAKTYANFKKERAQFPKKIINLKYIFGMGNFSKKEKINIIKKEFPNSYKHIYETYFD